MRKTMVYLENGQHDFLVRRAQKERRSIAELIREAVDAYMRQSRSDVPDLSFLGSVEGPPGDDASERDEEIMRQLLQ